MAFHKNLITLSILAVVAPAIFADDTTTQQLETLTSQAHPLVQTAADFAVADQVIEQKTLKNVHRPSGMLWQMSWGCIQINMVQVQAAP